MSRFLSVNPVKELRRNWESQIQCLTIAVVENHFLDSRLLNGAIENRPENGAPDSTSDNEIDLPRDPGTSLVPIFKQLS